MSRAVAVPKGYKQTEVGVIPEDWTLAPIGEHFEFKNGLNKAKQFFGTGKPIVNYMDVYAKSGLEATDIHGKVSLSSEERQRYAVRKGDVFFTRTSETLDEVGLTSVLLDEIDDAVFSGFILRARPITDSFSLNFKKYCFRTKTVRNQITSSGTYTTRALTNGRYLSRIKVPLPPTKSEQEAIAEALNDSDALIESLERLIAKKRRIKQGAMQELLRPKGDWVETTLIELANGKKELFDDGDWVEAEHITNEGVRLVQTGNIGVGQFIEKNENKYIFESSFVSLRCKQIEEGDLLICRLAEPAGRACVLPDIGEAKVVTSVDVTIFRPAASTANRVFLSNLFSTDQWFRAVSDRSGGTTHKRISRGALGRITITIPSVEEQTAIAAILSDMDMEITALKAKITKARQIKQGMMQELLTGRIRLV